MCIRALKHMRHHSVSIMFAVYAVDRGEPPLSASSIVIVHILDSNDNTPEFTENIYYGNIDENSLPDSTVIMVSHTLVFVVS